MGEAFKAREGTGTAASGMHAAIDAKDGLGPWEPIDLSDAVRMFQPAPFWWAVAGGWAIDIFLDAQTRHHHDLDITVVREQLPSVFETLVLLGWDCHVAAMGELYPWNGTQLDPGRNNIWCRRPGEHVWRFDLLITEVDDGDWVFRRNPRIRLPMADAFIEPAAGRARIVAPHVQMLFKARHRGPKDDADLVAVLPHLDAVRRRWLHNTLRTTEGHDHPWVPITAALP